MTALRIGMVLSLLLQTSLFTMADVKPSVREIEYVDINEAKTRIAKLERAINALEQKNRMLDQKISNAEETLQHNKDVIRKIDQLIADIDSEAVKLDLYIKATLDKPTKAKAIHAYEENMISKDKLKKMRKVKKIDNKGLVINIDFYKERKDKNQDIINKYKAEINELNKAIDRSKDKIGVLETHLETSSKLTSQVNELFLREFRNKPASDR